MPFNSISKSLLLVGLALVIAGCKLEVIVPTGGDVRSVSGARDCAGGSICEHNVKDATFVESFTAVARPGYKFYKWNAGPGFLCGDSVDPVCTISSVGWPEDRADVKAMFASDNIFYAMPHFQFVGIDTDGDDVADHVDEDDDNDGYFDEDDACPLNPDPDCAIDSIIVDGRTWAQPAQFVPEGGLSWNDVNAVCPGAVCKGTLNGHDVTGWTWATTTEMAELFYYYHEDKEFVASGHNEWNMINSPWAPKFFDDGWIPTYICDTPQCGGDPREDWVSLSGHLYQPNPIDRYTFCCGGYAVMHDYLDANSDRGDSFFYHSSFTPVDQSAGSGSGVWLYRD